MKKGQILGLSLILVLMLMTACAPKTAPAPAAAPAAKAAWEGTWDKVVDSAKQEANVIILSSGSPGERDAMMQGMKKFGINAEVTLGTINSVLAKIKAERQAGLYLWDVHIGGYNPILFQVKPEGIVDYPLDSQLILPDLTEPEKIKQVWYQGRFPWVDKDHSVYVLTLQPRPPIAINTNLVKEGEIKSYRDLLDPKWKGKIIMNDPTTPSGAMQWVGAATKIMGEDFIKELVKMEPMLTRDERLHLDWVAKGKMAIGLAPDGEQLPEFEKAGAPLKVVTPVEGGYASGASSGVSLFNKAPHPNAAKVFMNWIATKEGQSAFVVGGANHSLRLDVATTHLRPEQTRQAGVKYLDASTEEFATYRRDVSDKLARSEFAKLVK